MTKVDEAIYKSMLEMLKNGSAFNYSAISRKANVSRQTIHNKIDKHTYQDLEKYKNK